MVCYIFIITHYDNKIAFSNCCFVNSWSRWADIQRHGHFKNKLEIEDIRTIARAMVSSFFTPWLLINVVTTCKWDSVYSAVCGFFVCYSNILGTAECFCTKFTGKTCLVPRSDKFECQGQRSRSPGTNRENCWVIPIWQCTVRCAPYSASDCSSRWGHSAAAGGDRSAQWWELSAACVRCMFGETFLVLV